jgi:16S rRNA (uracil1498-N3)-methyltransferase
MPQRLVIDPAQKQDQLITFTKPQQHYLYRVLRLQAGDQVIVLDGRGSGWLVAMAGEMTGQIVEPWTVNNELAISITLMVALPKNGFDEVVYQATELGVSRVIPVISDRTLLRPSSNKLQRWRSIAQEATEQSERQIVPQILDPLTFSASLDLTASLKHKYICTPRQNAPNFADLLAAEGDRSPELTEMVILTGCEGGFTDQEVEKAIFLSNSVGNDEANDGAILLHNAKAIVHNFQPVSLGKRILRAVTAPLVALAIIASKLD